MRDAGTGYRTRPANDQKSKRRADLHGQCADLAFSRRSVRGRLGTGAFRWIRFVWATGGPLRGQRSATRDSGARDGVASTLSGGGPDALLRSRQPLRERGLPERPGRSRDHVQHEPSRELPRQRRCRELVLDAEGRARGALLQPAAPALGSGLRQPSRVRKDRSRSVGSVEKLSTRSDQAEGGLRGEPTKLLRQPERYRAEEGSEVALRRDQLPVDRDL